MSTCQRFEQEGLLRLEQGLPLDAHFSTCPDCQRARLSYERLQADLGSLAPLEPPAGWEGRVWNRILNRTAAPQPRRWLFLASSGLAAAIVVAILTLPSIFQRSPSPTLRAEVQAGVGPTQRGEILPGSPVLPGSRLVLSATTGGARHVELRVYRNDDQLVLQTSRVGDGAARDEALRATLLLDAVGRYQAAVFISSEPIPPPSGAPDDDYAAARQVGAQIILGSEISVR